MKTLPFKFLTGDVNWMDYGGKWISPRQNNGEFDYWFVIEFINWEDATGERTDDGKKYCASLSVVSPSEAGEHNLTKAAECCGINLQEIADKPECLVDILHSYGVYTQTWSQSGNNANALLREARRESTIQCSFTFGFAMDRPVNRIGTTGWEALRGDLNSALARTIESGSTEGKILAKMHGISAA